jgi:hypothetical protein
MPKQFLFNEDEDDDEENQFSCILEKLQCTGTNKNGSRCKRKCIVPYEYCYQHLASIKKLRVKKSTIANAGLGLFALDKQAGPDSIVFRKDDIISDYNGRILNFKELNRLYGFRTAPYAAKVNENYFIDAACKRGVGSIANRNPGNNNAKILVDHRNKKVRIRALKPIKNNQEIFMSYGNSYIMADNHRTINIF